jgi:hypothetical protein
VGRRYVLSGENLTMGTGSVLAAMQTDAAGVAGSMVEVERVDVSQSGTATAAQVRLLLSSRNALGTLTVTAATPRPLVIGGPASGVVGGTSPLTAGTCGVASTADTGGTYTDLFPFAANNLGGFSYLAIPEHVIELQPSTLFVVRFAAPPGTLTGWDVAVVFHEAF